MLHCCIAMGRAVAWRQLRFNKMKKKRKKHSILNWDWDSRADGQTDRPNVRVARVNVIGRAGHSSRLIKIFIIDARHRRLTTETKCFYSHHLRTPHHSASILIHFFLFIRNTFRIRMREKWNAHLPYSFHHFPLHIHTISILYSDSPSFIPFLFRSHFRHEIQ